MVEDLGRPVGVCHGSWKRGQGAEIAGLLYIDMCEGFRNGELLNFAAVRSNLKALKAHADDLRTQKLRYGSTKDERRFAVNSTGGGASVEFR
jgi:hypothetical protein